MANLLGIPSYDPSLDRLNMQLQSQAIQQLGQQVRQDLQQIQTNRQLTKFTEGLVGLSPQSQDFSKGVIGLMQQYPMAAHSPIGQAAINQLGAEHKLWQQEQLRNATPYQAVGGGYGVIDKRTGTITPTPEGILPSKKIQFEKDAYGNVIAGFDPNNMNQEVALPEMPIRTSEDAVELEKLRQQNRLDLQAKRTPSVSPEIKSLSTAQSRLLTEYAKKDAEAKKHEAAWAAMGDPNDPAKWSAGIKAQGLKAEAEALRGQLESVSHQLRNYSQKVVDENAVNPEGLIPSIPAPQPSSSGARKRRFNISTGTLE